MRFSSTTIKSSQVKTLVYLYVVRTICKTEVSAKVSSWRCLRQRSPVTESNQILWTRMTKVPTAAAAQKRRHSSYRPRWWWESPTGRAVTYMLLRWVTHSASDFTYSTTGRHTRYSSESWSPWTAWTPVRYCWSTVTVAPRTRPSWAPYRPWTRGHTVAPSKFWRRRSMRSSFPLRTSFSLKRWSRRACPSVSPSIVTWSATMERYGGPIHSEGKVYFVL